MSAREVSWLRDAFNLIYYYKRSEEVRERVNSTFAYNNRPVFFYIEALIRFSPNYFRYYQQVFQRNLSYFYNRRVRQIWKDILPNRIWSFFDKCDNDRQEVTRILLVLSNPATILPLYDQNELSRLSQIDNLSYPQRINVFNSVLSGISKTILVGGRGEKIQVQPTKPEEKLLTPEETVEHLKAITPTVPTKPTTPEETISYLKEIKPEKLITPTTPEETVEYLKSIQTSEKKEEEKTLPRVPRRLKIPKAVKDITSQGQITARRLGINTARGLGSLAKGVGSGLLRGGGSLAGRAGTFALQAGVRGLVALGTAIGGGGALVVGIAVVAVILLIFVLPVLLNILESSALLPPFQQVGVAAPITPPGPGPIGIVSSCPIPNGRISCGSYKNQTRPCHCIDTYPPRLDGTLCNPLLQNGILTRTAKSIDVKPKARNGQPGDKVYLPSIQGQTIKWKYLKTDTDKKGFGHLRLFQSERTAQGIWSMYMIHVDRDNPALTRETAYDPGQEVAWIGPGQDHVHINIGLNIGNFGENDFFDPGWKFPDTQMGMCAAAAPSPILDRFVVGNSVNGTEIEGFKIGSGNIRVALIAGMHGGTEPQSTKVVRDAMTEFQNNPSLVPNNITLYFIPVVNVEPGNIPPFGRWNAKGVDLNRNYNSSSVPGGAWSEEGCSINSYAALPGHIKRSCGDDEGTSSLYNVFCNNPNRAKTSGGREVTFACYSGKICPTCTNHPTGNNAFSEPETQALQDFVKNKDGGIKVVLSYHAPFGEVTISNGGPRVDKTKDLAVYMARNLGLQYNDFFPNYPVTGQFMDWLQDERKIGVEIELPAGPDYAKNVRVIKEAINWISQNVSP